MNTEPQRPVFSPGEYGSLLVKDLARLLPHARLIDVREPDEFHGELGHLEGAELVPLAQLSQVCRSWSRDAPLVMICRSGNRSSQAARALSQMGFTQVHNLEGGMLEVRNQGG